MTGADMLILTLAIVNMAGIVFSIGERYRWRRRWLNLVNERAALEIFLREECQYGIHFRREGEMLHLDVYRTNQSSPTQHLDRRHGRERRTDTDDDIPSTVN